MLGLESAMQSVQISVHNKTVVGSIQVKENEAKQSYYFSEQPVMRSIQNAIFHHAYFVPSGPH